MSIQPYDWPDQLQQLLREARQAGGEDAARAAAAEAAFYDQLLERVCTSGRPFLLMEVRGSRAMYRTRKMHQAIA